jgi:hypothetical protein
MINSGHIKKFEKLGSGMWKNRNQPMFKGFFDVCKTDDKMKKSNLDRFSFLMSARKILIDVDEFSEWMDWTKGFLPLLTIFEQLNYLPSKKIWIEFCKLKEMKPIGFGLGMKMNNGEMADCDIWTVGVDLENHYLYSFAKCKQDFDNSNEDLVFHKIRIHPNSAQSYVFMAVMNLIPLLMDYLETEYIDIQTKSFSIGKKMRRGKLIDKLNPYQIIYRKQPIQTTVHPTNAENAETDWNFRWKVRGHWRRVKGFGKDQLGNLKEGFTWIKEFVKGPEDKPLIERPIILKNQLPRKVFR